MKVLIAEPDESLRSKVKSLCDYLGYQSISTSSLEEAQQQSLETSFDLIYSAHYLNDATGFELSRYIRQQRNYQSTPIVLTSKDPQPTLIEKALSTGITEVFRLDQWLELQAFFSRMGEHTAPIEGRVLLVEDSLSQQLVVQSTLESFGLQVDTAIDVDSAWQLLQEHYYNLVLTDIVLASNSSGLTLVNQIRRQAAPIGDTPIIAMTGYDDRALKVELFRLGVDEYISKPIIFDELIARTRRLITLSNLHAQVRRNHTSLSQFLSRMSHECRNSINIILGLSRLLKKNEDDFSRRQFEQLGMIERAADHQLSLVNDILDHAKLQNHQLQVEKTNCSIYHLVTETIDMFAFKCEEKDVQLNSNIAVDVPHWLLLDYRKTKQILINLLGNAIKFTQQGSINVSISLTQHKAKNMLDLCVSDTGPGIAEADQARLFEAFAQTELGRDNQQGTGLGLTICVELAQLMSGHMHVNSQLGVGSQFHCLLPCEVE